MSRTAWGSLENLPATENFQNRKMAEREGFEPSVQLPVQQFSRLPHSTALAPLLT